MKPRETQVPLTVVIPIKDRNGNVVGEKEVASYAGLLAQAHAEGLKRIESQVLQTPTAENGETAIVLAVVETERGVFTGIGDANPGNVNRKIAPHIIRMADTRAKARALRDAVNIGVVALEELGGEAVEADEYESGHVAAETASARPLPAPSPRSRPERQVAPRAKTRQPAPSPHIEEGSANVPITEAQRRYLYRLVSDLGIEGDAATGFLLEALKVDDLRDVPRPAASALIDRLKAQVDGRAGQVETGGGGNGASTPF